MRFRWVLLGSLAVSLLHAPAGASEAVEALLWKESSPAGLRARLLAFAAVAPESAVAGKGAAFYYAALSFERAGRTDSALTLFERAVAVQGLARERDALVDALLARGQAADARRAQEILAPRLVEALRVAERDIAVTRGRQAWALYLAGQGDSALRLMRSQERWLLDARTPRHRDWRYRLGFLDLEHGGGERTPEIMLPLALASRFQDTDVMSILRDALKARRDRGTIAAAMQGELQTLDEGEQILLDSLRATRVSFQGLDGFPLSGVVVAPAGRRPARALVALLGHEEPVEIYDSLAVGLRRAGYAVLLIEPRGAGRSVSTTCPLPETWRGREDEMHARVARDVLAGLRALAAHATVDTTRYLVAGAGAMASPAIEATRLDPRARALILFAPQPSPVVRGAALAWLRESGAPAFFVVPVMDRATLPVAEELYGVAPRASRIAESEWVGNGVAIFRRDVTALPRLLQWLEETWASGGAAPRAGRR